MRYVVVTLRGVVFTGMDVAEAAIPQAFLTVDASPRAGLGPRRY
jgi:hypothetical protein